MKLEAPLSEAIILPTITEKWCKVGRKLVLVTDRKSHTGLEVVTLSDVEQPSGRHFALFHPVQQRSELTASNSLKLLYPYCQRRILSPASLDVG